jgi:F0F1-type ATP synthase membrane subunit c/vacuolar-type H+-ATPase subunit K
MTARSRSGSIPPSPDERETPPCHHRGMGPLLMTAFNVLGAGIAIGIVAGRTPGGVGEAADGRPSDVRRLAIILLAYAEGIGVLGIVVGLLAVVIGRISPDTNRWLAISPAFVGAILGLGLAFRSSFVPNAQVRLVAIGFIVGLAILAGIVAFLSALLPEIGSTPPPDLPFVLAGLVAAAATMGLGWVGTEAMAGLTVADSEARRALLSRQIRRVFPYQVVAYVASAVAIAMVVVTPR